jgi:hypothetical protein
LPLLVIDTCLGACQAALADGTIKKLSLQWFKTDISPQS